MNPDIPSPRTASEPRAFTAGEFLHGTVASWLSFNLLFAIAVIVGEASTHDPALGPLAGMLAALLAYLVPVSLVVSGIVALLCCGAAWALGRALRRVGPPLPHLIGYAVLGCAIGAVVVALYQLVVAHALDFSGGLTMLVPACSAAALPLGWGWSVRSARRADAGLIRSSRVDPDATAEDFIRP